jgi:uncharacterized Zn finger protein
MTVEHAVFQCSHCGRTVEHELKYAGRLLELTRCSACGHVVELQQRALLPAYIHDLEQRVASKPRRLARRAKRDRKRFWRELPRAVARQPAKFAREVWSLFRR